MEQARKAGHSRLVYDKTRRTIVPVKTGEDALINDLVETLSWVRKNYAGGSTKKINARIDAMLAKARG